MKLHKLIIQNYRKLKNVTIYCADATFLIGANNVGKSTVLDALDLLLNDSLKLDNSLYKSKSINNETGFEKQEDGDIEIQGEFRNVPLELLDERGFNKERMFSYKTDNTNDTGYGFNYRVRFDSSGKGHREMKLYSQHLKTEFEKCTKPSDFITAGASQDRFIELFGKELLDKKITPKTQHLLSEIPEIWKIDTSNDEWFENPGGIPGNVLSKLPHFLKIPANSNSEEVESNNGAMRTVLNQLFEQVREVSPHYKQAQEALNELAKEMNPNESCSEFGKLISSLNTVVGRIFPTAYINVDANLSDPNKVLKPDFDIRMTSNVTTPVNYQGTGMIRSVVFALLKFCKEREDKIGNTRGIIVGFEEPELFLHPNAANNMRDVIYELATDSSQILATTHSPYMIDLSRKPKLVLNNLKLGIDHYTDVMCFNISKKFNDLQENDKARVKMIQKIDDYIARVFFAQKVVIVEGDTEDILLKNTIAVMPELAIKGINEKYQIIKATGKATMISFIKYLKAMDIDIFVIHDEDSETAGAAKMNAPILAALDNDLSKRLMMHNCVEDEIGYQIPTSDKPYHAFEISSKWNSWNDIPENWRKKMTIIFSDFKDILDI